MNPLNLYITTCRMVLQSSAEDDSAWADISRLLSCLRQSLTCCVCSKILNCPITSSVSTCNHTICRDCIGGKMRMKPSCSRCNDHTKFVENSPVKILIQCYKKLCEYIMNSAASHHRGRLGNLNGGTTTSFAEIVQEGAELTSDFQPASALVNQTVNTANLRNAIMNLCPKVGIEFEDDGFNKTADGRFTNGNSTTPYTEADSSKPVHKSDSDGCDNVKNEASEVGGSPVLRKDMTTSTIPLEIPGCFRPKRRNCRCGVATPNPGKLTCCGQRCPCYVDQRACVHCRCRGCRNPNRVQNKNVHYQGIQLEVQETAEVDCYVENMVDANGDIAA